MQRKSTKKYRHDMIQAWVHQINNKWVEDSFDPHYSSNEMGE